MDILLENKLRALRAKKIEQTKEKIFCVFRFLPLRQSGRKRIVASKAPLYNKNFKL